MGAEEAGAEQGELLQQHPAAVPSTGGVYRARGVGHAPLVGDEQVEHVRHERLPVRKLARQAVREERGAEQHEQLLHPAAHKHPSAREDGPVGERAEASHAPADNGAEGDRSGEPDHEPGEEPEPHRRGQAGAERGEEGVQEERERALERSDARDQPRQRAEVLAYGKAREGSEEAP